MSEFRMPSLGADMQYGTVVGVAREAWRCGQARLRRGAGRNRKGRHRSEIFESGVIESLVIQPGQKVPVGTTLATLSGDGKRAAPQAAASPMAVAAVITTSVQEKEPSTKAFIAPESAQAARLRVSPLARKRAQEWAWIYHMSPTQALSIQLQWPM